MRGKMYFASGLVFLLLLSPSFIHAKKVDYFIINPADFVPVFDYTSYEIQTSFLACYPETTYTWFIAPIHLPNGAKIKSVRIFYKDNHSTEHIDVIMRRSDIWSGLWENMFGWDSTGDEEFLRIHEVTDAEIVGGIIDNTTYGYSILIQLGGFIGMGFGRDLTLGNVQITYEVPHGNK